MCTCTPIYGLATVEGTDAPCDVEECLCQFANDVEAELDRLDGVVDRTATSRPMVQLAATVPVALASFPPTYNINFDTVGTDTDNMFSGDLPEIVTVNTAGIYVLTAYTWATVTGPGGTDSASNTLLMRYVPVGTSGTSTFWIDSRTMTAAAGNTFLSMSAIYPFNAGDQVFLSQGGGVATAGTITFQETQFSLTWVGDLA